MLLARFLNKLFKTGGFVLIGANQVKYLIGNPKKKKSFNIKIIRQKIAL